MPPLTSSHPRRWLIILTGLLSFAFIGCGSSEPAELPPGDATNGAALIQKPIIGSDPSPGCLNCHSLEPETRLVGPSLADLTDLDPDTLREAIVNPDEVLTEGYSSGSMFSSYGETLSDQEIADLIAYLIELNSLPE